MNLKKLKKIVAVVILLCIVLLTITSCSGSTGAVYNEYKELIYIGAFNNGLAPFVVYYNDGTYHSYSWVGTYKFGYIDIKGNVVIKPEYECSPSYYEIPAFYYNYVRISDKNDRDCIIDKKGQVIFQVGRNNVTEIVGNNFGYFKVSFVEESFLGNNYVDKYYSAENMQEVDRQKYIDSEYQDFEGMNVDIDNISEFRNAYIYSTTTSSGYKNSFKCLATVCLKNQDGDFYYSTVDQDGNILMKPQKNISFARFDWNEGKVIFAYNYNLCPAMDEKSGLWGYIDPNGDWKIKPQYASAYDFSEDGYATVNSKIVINTSGKVVLSPSGWKNEIVTELYGEYKYSISDQDYILTFSSENTCQIKEIYGSIGSSWRDGTYEIKGGQIIFNGLGSYGTYPILSGSYSFVKEGNTLIIDGLKFEKYKSK